MVIEIIEIEMEVDSVIETEVEITTEISEPGPPGPPGSVDDFEESFPSSLQWIVNHNLGRRPSVTLFTTGGIEMIAEIIHISVNQLTVNFITPTSGSVRCV